ncbi:MAG: hypothetical protein NZ521_10280, partial [Flammeovirgaceae bacterium]|nr:hypothetical protein [Flammeovirgaceae bacterium]MDW8288410.1 hypothetical protein [Flammeovirgaceae bacterium]
MNYDEISTMLAQIIDKRAELNQFSQTTPEYQSLRSSLKKLESEFVEKYGSQLREILLDVHDEYCPDIEVLPVLQYIGKEYKVIGKNEWGNLYEVDHNQ